MALDEETNSGTVSDEDLVRRVLAGERACFELLIRRNNQRLFRAVRAVVTDNDEAADVMQEAYVAAFTHLEQFAARSRFSTWLTRIALNEAFARTKRRKRLTQLNDESKMEDTVSSAVRGPEQRASDRELGVILEDAVDSLPEPFRTVFVLRSVEQLSVTETSELLDIPEETVKTRLHRAKNQLRHLLTERVGAKIPQIYDFHRSRCDLVVARVMARLAR